MKKEAILVAVLVLLAACSAEMPDEPAQAGDEAVGNTAQVTGTLMYRERIALPPGAVAEIWLLDTSLVDSPARTIDHQEIEAPGSPPIPFALEYDPQQIEQRMQYSVRATIRHDGQLLFTSDTHYPVLTRGAGDTVDIMLIMVDPTIE